MEALYSGTTNLNYQPNKREEAMNTTSASVEHLELPGQGFVMESIVGKISLVAVISAGYLIAFSRGYYAK